MSKCCASWASLKQPRSSRLHGAAPLAAPRSGKHRRRPQRRVRALCALAPQRALWWCRDDRLAPEKTKTRKAVAHEQSGQSVGWMATSKSRSRGTRRRRRRRKRRVLCSRTRPSSATCATLRPRRLVANRQRRVATRQPAARPRRRRVRCTGGARRRGTPSSLARASTASLAPTTPPAATSRRCLRAPEAMDT